MKTVLHRATDRGRGDYEWLVTRYSFSFADWYEPARIGFGVLRVINDDWIAPKKGFGAHPHHDMEIITIVTSGVLTHEDNMGNRGVISAGDVQVMSAGTGVIHSERNEGDEPLTLFQVWIEPRERGLTPRYEERTFPQEAGVCGAVTLVAPCGTPQTLGINQDACLARIVLDETHPFVYSRARAYNGIYLFVISGELHVAGEVLGARDAIGITETASIELRAPQPTSVLVFDVPQ